MLEFLLFCGLIFLLVVIGNKVKEQKEASRLAEIKDMLKKREIEDKFWMAFNASSPYNPKSMYDYKKWMKHRVRICPKIT